jgi:hypothetical protein
MRSAQQIRVTQNMLPNNGHTLPSNDVVINKESNIPTSRAVQVSHQKIILCESESPCAFCMQNSRRSNVVKEVEKLKKNREERRQRQAEEKAEKEAFLQLAPGNPHWELLNMIL